MCRTIDRFEQNISDMAFLVYSIAEGETFALVCVAAKKTDTLVDTEKNWVKKYGQSETKLSEESDNSQDSSVIQRKTRVLWIVQKI